MKHRSTVQERRRRGYALLSSVMFVCLSVVIATAVLSLASTSRRTSEMRVLGAQALQLAIGATDDALTRLKTNTSYTGFSNRSFGAGTVSVTVTTPVGTSVRRVILATAKVSNGSLSITRKIQATADTGQVADVFNLAVASKQSFSVNGNVSIGSNPVHLGNVHSNQNVAVTGTSSYIDGAVSASGTATSDGQGTITEGISSGTPVVTFPDVTSDYEELSLVNGSTIGDVSVSDGSTVKGHITGSLTVGASKGCQITGVVWVSGSVTVNGPITGTGTVVCDGTITVKNRANYPNNSTVSVLLITTSTANGAIAVSGNGTFIGSLYAPYGDVQLSGSAGSTIDGGVMGNTVSFTGNVNIVRNVNFSQSPPPLPSILQVRGWQEF